MTSTKIIYYYQVGLYQIIYASNYAFFSSLENILIGWFSFSCFFYIKNENRFKVKE